MNKEDYRKHIEDYNSQPGYSYVRSEDKSLIMKFHDLLVDVMLDPVASKTFIEMFKDDGNTYLPDHCLNPDYVEEIEDFENMTVHNDILDDGEFWLLYDAKNKKLHFNRTYDFLDNAENICRKLGLKTNEVKVGSISSYMRSLSYIIPNTLIKIASLGIEDFCLILEALKDRKSHVEVTESLPLVYLNSRLDIYNGVYSK